MSAQLLMVDDEPGLREAVKDYLQERFHCSLPVTECWELMQQNTPDLVISDIMMPQVDGYQFSSRCGKTPRQWCFNRQGMTTDRIQGYQAGVDAHLPKPFDPDELVAIVENLLERRAAQDQTRGEDGETPDIADLANQIAQIKALLTQRNAIKLLPQLKST